MLFLSDSIIEARQRLLLDVANGKIDAEQIWRKALKLDPDDHLAMIALAHLRVRNEDKAEAEEFLWRAIQSQPCAWRAYWDLSLLLKDDEPLSKGLAELGRRKLLLTPGDLEEMEGKLSPGLKEGVESVGQGFEILADTLRAQRDLESLAVTARLRSLRLIHQLQVNEFLEVETIDAIVQEGESIVPLLVGVLRGWAQDVISDEDIFVAANSMALLGEIGETSAIPPLLELVTLEDPEASGPAGWALDRIVEQHPEQAAQVFWDLAPGLTGGGKIAATERLVRYPQMVASVGLFERLFENLDKQDAEDRDVCFQILISSAIIVLGRAGFEFARTMLRRHGGLLSRKMRRDCDEMIEEFSSMAIPARPRAEPSPYTVYDICSGDVDWEAEAEAAIEEDDDQLSPEPVRRKAIPGRNDPCWCGSGKKYKKCHLDSDEAADRDVRGPAKRSPQAPGAEFDDLRQRIGEFMTQEQPKREIRVATKEFFGGEEMDPEMGPFVLIDWMIHDRISPTFGRTVMEEYVARHGASLTNRERQFLESSVRSHIDLFEVQDIKEGRGLEVKSLTSGDTSFVHDISMSKVVSRWDGLYARMVNGGRGLEFSGTGVQVPRMYLDAVWHAMEKDKIDTGLSWPVYLKRNWPRVCAQQTQIQANWMDSIKLTNTDGEELVASRAFYQVLDRGEMLASLRAAPKLSEEEKGAVFVWLSAEENGTVLGRVPIVGGQLVLECNSKQRLKKGKRLLADLAGAAVQFEKDEFTTQEEIKRSVRENPKPSQSTKDEISPELKQRLEREYMEDHYAEWPDMKLPALDGKTPRQAVKNAAGKRKVAEILKHVENVEAHKRKAGKYAYDVSKLRAELGVKG